MMFPKHNILPADADHPLFKEAEQKCIGFSPLPFCEFFQGMDVLQMYGEDTGEYIYGLYIGGRLVGTVYYGHLYTEIQVAQLQKHYLPKDWENIPEFVLEKKGVKYCKMASSQYAFVFDRVLKKIE